MNVDFFYSPIGLGHVTRDIAIVENFKNIRINFVTGSGAAEILQKNDYQVKNVYNPPSFIVKDGALKNQAKWYGIIINIIKIVKIFHKKLFKLIIQIW